MKPKLFKKLAKSQTTLNERDATTQSARDNPNGTLGSPARARVVLQKKTQTCRNSIKRTNFAKHTELIDFFGSAKIPQLINFMDPQKSPQLINFYGSAKHKADRLLWVRKKSKDDRLLWVRKKPKLIDFYRFAEKTKLIDFYGFANNELINSMDHKKSCGKV